MKHIYYGFGKGKTSTLTGSAVRAAGAGKKVAYFRFLKNSSSEDPILKKITDFQSFRSYKDKFIWNMDNSEINETKKMMTNAIGVIKEKIIANEYDLVCLDEFTDLIQNKYISEKDAIEFINIINKEVEILMSGHHKHEQLFENVDLITHFEPQKHYFDQGVQARKGIEF